MHTNQYHRILSRSNVLIGNLTDNMQTWDNWTDEKKQLYNIHEKAEQGRYLFAQIKALIREQDTGSPFLELCSEEEINWADDIGVLYHQYILILHAFNEHLEAFIE